MFKPIVKYLLRKRAKESDRTSSLVHGDLIMKIAVVAHYSDDESFSHIVSYVKELRKRGKKVVDFYVFFDFLFGVREVFGWMRIEISSKSCVFRGRELRFGADS